MKLPTRSPTHADVEMSRLASMGLELDDIADGGHVTLSALAELAEDRGRPASHYLAAVPLATELLVSGGTGLAVRVCAGTCQRYGALDLLDALVARWQHRAGFDLVPVSCLDRCDQAPACEVDGAHGKLVIAPASGEAVIEAIDSLSA